MYSKLTNDATVQVRDAAHTLMGLVGRVVQAELEPHIPTVLPRWWIAQFDPRSEARQSAESTLRATFPGRRINKALRLCHKPLFAELQEIFDSSPQTVVDIKAVEGLDVAKEMYERQVYCGLLALGGFIEKLVEVEKFDDGLRARVVAILEPVTFWKLVDSKFAQIRLGFFKLLPVLCQHMASAVEAHLDKVAPSVLGAMSDKEAGNYSAIWPAILHLVKALPRSWSHVDVKKVVLPRMCSCLRAAAYGSWAVTYPAVLPWLSTLPRSMMVSELAAELCDALWHPIVSGAVPSSAYHLIVTAWAECAAHMISSAKAAAASEPGGLTDADVAGWAALPVPQKPNGKPTPEQLAGLKAAKLARNSFLQETADGLGVEWTPKMVEKELEQMKGRADSRAQELEPEPVMHEVDPSEEFYRVCLLNPSMKRLSEGQPKVVECWAAATAKQTVARPTLQADHVDQLLAEVAAVTIDAVAGSDVDAAVMCARWFVPLVRSFDLEANAAALQLAQTVAHAVLQGSGQSIPPLTTLDLLAGLSEPPLSFKHAIPTDGSATIHDKLVGWLTQTAVDSDDHTSVAKLLSSYLGSIDDISMAAVEWDVCVSSILDGHADSTQALVQLLQISIDSGVSIPMGVAALEKLATSEDYLQRLFGTSGQSVAELLLLGQPLLSTDAAQQLIEWLTLSLEHHSNEIGAGLRNLHVLVNGILAADTPTDRGKLGLRSRARILTQIFILQVPVTCPLGGFGNGALHTSEVCAACCEEMWNEHSPSLLEAVDGAVPGDAWTSALPELVKQILAMLLCSELKMTNGKADPIVACVKLASEMLATSKCISSTCLQQALGGLLQEIVPALSSSYGATGQDLGKRWSRVLSFTVGISSAVHPIDLFLGADDDYRQWLLLELFLYGGLEPVRVNGNAKDCLLSAMSNARLLSECDLREFWTYCCQGTLPSEGAEPPKLTANEYVLRTVKLAQELSVSAADGRFAGLLTTLFPETDAGRPGQGASLASALVQSLDDAVVRPAQHLLLKPTAELIDAGALQNASAVLYSLLPHLPVARGWEVTQACVDRLCCSDEDHEDHTLHSAAIMLVAGHGLATAIASSAFSSDPSPVDEAELARQRRATELSEGSETSDDEFEDASESECVHPAPTSATVRDYIRTVLSHVRRTTAVHMRQQTRVAECFFCLGVSRMICAALRTGMLDDGSADATSRQEDWEFCVGHAIKAATPHVADHDVSEWCTRTHRAGLELVAEILAKLQILTGLLGKAQCEAFEDALTGATYCQLVDEESMWSPAILRSLAAILPVWTSPERTVLLGYTDELVCQLSSPQYIVRSEIYQWMIRLASASLEDMTTRSSEMEEDSDDELEAAFSMEATQIRPELVPQALCDLIQHAPKHDDLLTIPAYLFSWAIILHMIANAPVKLRSELVDMITVERSGQSAASHLLSALTSLLPLESGRPVNSGRKSVASAGVPPLSVIRDGGSASEVAAALFGRALRQVRKCLRSSSL
jgi:hypothetical protein